MLTYCIIAFLMAVTTLSAREWTSADGKNTFHGELIKYVSGYVTVIRDGEWRETVFKIEVLSQKDQDFLREFKRQQDIREKAARQLSKNKYNGRFKVAQVAPDGVHAYLMQRVYNPNTYRYEYRQSTERIFIHGYYSLNTASNEEYVEELFWTGSYTYTTTENSSFTVKSYVTDRQIAIDFWASQYGLDDNDNVASKPTNKSKYVDVTGTGFAVTKSGYIVTNAHVVEDARRIKVRMANSTVSAEMVSIDRLNDLALIKVNKELMPLKLEANSRIDIGDEIIVAGFPNVGLQGSSVKITKGVISAMKGFQDDVRWYQIDASIQPGNSGGPLMNSEYAVVGVVNAKLDDMIALEASGSLPQNINYSIKLDYLFPLLRAESDVSNDLNTAIKDKRSLSEIANNSIFLIEASILE